MARNLWIHFGVAIVIAIVALLLIRLHYAGGASDDSHGPAAGHRLAEAWCRSCHNIEAITAGTSSPAPDFAAVARMPSTTALSLKVFLQSSHPTMPNVMLTPDQTDDLVSYILSLKRN
jgi:cytochrome c